MIKIRALYLVIASIIAAALSLTGILVGMYLDLSNHSKQDLEVIKFFIGIIEGAGVTCMLLFIICKKEIKP